MKIEQIEFANNKSQLPFVIVSVILAIIVAWFSPISKTEETGSSTEELSSVDPENTTVIVKQIVSEPFKRTLSLSGQSYPNDEFIVASRNSGTLYGLIHQEGDIVYAGDFLFGIRNDSLKAEYDNALLQLNEAENTFKNAEVLFQRSVYSQSKLNEVRIHLENKKQAFTSAKERLSELTVVSSHNGIIKKIHKTNTESITGNEPIVEICSVNPIVFKGFVSQFNYWKVQQGDLAKVILPDSSELTGFVSDLSKIGDENTRTFDVEVQVQNNGYKIPIALGATIELEYDSINAFHIPSSALIIDDDGAMGIHTVNLEKKVEFHQVEIVASDKQGVWIKAFTDKIDMIVSGQNLVNKDNFVSVVRDES